MRGEHQGVVGSVAVRSVNLPCSPAAEYNRPPPTRGRLPARPYLHCRRLPQLAPQQHRAAGSGAWQREPSTAQHR